MKKILLVLLLLINGAYAQPIINFSAICVDSVWYDANNHFVNVSIYNGDTNSVNYPVVQIINTNGDTISNPDQTLSFFAHAAGYHQTYTDPIIDQGITDFSNYTFVFYDMLWDTSATIGYCATTSINENKNEKLTIYPNPVNDVLYIDGLKQNHHCTIYNVIGEMMMDVENDLGSIDVSELKQGVYFLRVDGVGGRAFLKE